MISPMNQDPLSRLRAQIGGPRDGSLLRFSLGNALLAAGEASAAAVAFREALAFDGDYSAAWKMLGRALVDAGEEAAAADAFEQGIDVARRRGDQQAEKEMRVFLRRLRNARRT